MKYRTLNKHDIFDYGKDALICYKDNKLIFDSQNPLVIDDYDSIVEFLLGFIDSEDSTVIGIFDDKESFLYGIVIFDNIRVVDKIVAEVHIAISKEIWGSKVVNIFKEMLENSLFDILYCTIPQIATRAIGMTKRLGFKKTGFIPCALPYKNSKGEEKLYDLNIFCYRKEGLK